MTAPSSRPRILFLVTKGTTGGTQMSVFSLAAALKKKGCPVTVGFGEGEFLPKKLAEHGIPGVRFRHLKRGYGWSNLRFMRELRRYLATHPFDIVHCNSTNTLFGAIAAKMVRPKPKTVFTFRGLSILDPNYTHSFLKRQFFRFFFRILLRWVDKKVFVSKENEAFAQTIGLAKNATVIYNGLSPEPGYFLERNKAREFFQKKVRRDLSRAVLVGSIGRLAYQKNYTFLIEQFARLAPEYPNAHCIIIGEGAERASLEERIRTRGMSERVFLLGDMPDAARYMTGFDIFVLPSHYEGFSVTILEALFAGLPILASDVGGAREQIEDAGILYPLNNTTDFQMHLQELLKNAAKRKMLSQEAKHRTSHFDIRRTAAGYADLYGRLDASS